MLLFWPIWYPPSIAECDDDLSLNSLNLQSFNENPYFEDRKLEKTYTFFEDGAIKITGTTIKWKDGSVTVISIKTIIPSVHLIRLMTDGNLYRVPQTELMVRRKGRNDR